ncbi:MAG TPA: ThuA domain-containing protein, partial [Cyclobacteriaceae bacterium]
MNPKIKSTFLVFILALSILSGCQQGKYRVLVFTKTKGYHHESIPVGIAAIQKLGLENNVDVDTTTDASSFQEDKLKNYKAVIFLSTTGDVLNADQQVAFERFIQAGGGYVGVHAAADTEYGWPWYNKLVGAYFMSHPGNPNVRKATINCIDTTHLSMKGLPARWERTDEWYNYKNIFTGIKVLATLDEETYEGGEHGDNHPIAWYHEIDGGRAFYTGGGHAAESYSEPLFLKHLWGGITYAIGKDVSRDYSKAYAVKPPEENRFKKTILANDLNEPMELAITSDGRVFYAERSGNLYVYLPSSHISKKIHKFDVMPDNKEGFGNGVLGLTIDPDYDKNNYIYIFYTPNTLPAHQNISRFKLGADNVLDLASEKILIEVPLELEVSAHTGGSLAWDKDKNLYISTGDNTVPFASDGFAPIDETPGRITFDAQRSAGNTNDLRGKILKIHPEEDGTYTIPEGNLFPKGTPLTRPEIYTMGCRNPYRMSVDQETSIVYWGEIGPDSGVDGKQGPRGYDEINQARKPGNYGWPFFVGDNKPYHEYDFATKTVGELFDPNAPVNPSVNNTGMKNLPPATKAMIWYPYDKSVEFPEVGTGGRSAIAGPVYHFNEGLSSATKFPSYFNKNLFIYDWMRNWVFTVVLDENQNFRRMEQFMPNTGDFRRPIDMEVGPEGSFYMLEYGSVYGIDNVDARLVRIDYNDGNRKPVARIVSNDTIGLAPFKVALSSKSSVDYDDDAITYEWQVDGKKITDANPEYTFNNNGVYNVILKVTDTSGAYDEDTLSVKVGNTLPEVAIKTDNSTFFFDKAPVKYQVEIMDKEDGTIDPSHAMVTLKYIPKAEQQLGHQQITSFNLGKTLMAGSDCKACHQINGKSVGPAFMEVASKYKNDKTALPRLAKKVITGGTGVWGDHGMNAHPQLSVEDATEIVKYVLSLADVKKEVSLPLSGSLALKNHKTKDETGRYALTASYTDKGGALQKSATNTSMLMLRSSRVQVEEADRIRNASFNWEHDRLGSINNKSFFMFKNIDLHNIKSITYHYSAHDLGATIEVHTGSSEGPVISTLNYEPTGSWDTYKDVTASVKDP